MSRAAQSFTDNQDGFDRLPPHSEEAERSLLASMMVDRDVIGDIVQEVSGEHFYLAEHQLIFDAVKLLWEQNRPIDALIVREELMKQGALEDAGGAAYLGRVLNSFPTSANSVEYARTVHEKAMLRQLISAAGKILNDAHSPYDDAGDVVEQAEKLIFEIAEKKIRGAAEPIEKTLHEVFEMIDRKAGGGIMTPWLDLNDLLNGLHPGEMIIVAARPSMGKTAFAMNVVEHLALNEKVACGVFSLEMSKQQLAQRMLCARSGVDGMKIRKSTLSAADHSRLIMAVGQLAKGEIFVDDTAGLSVTELRAKARRLKAQHDIGCIMIDYLQLMEGSGKSREGRQQEITEISRGIKAVARELEVPVIALSQLNRAAEGREGHRPRMSDLRESGSIEQDADVVILLHREDYYHKGEPNYEPTHVAEIIVAKQRNGPTDTVKLTFDNKTTSFRSLASGDEGFA